MALKKKQVDNLYMLVCGFMGFVLFIMASIGFSNMYKECTNPLIYDGMLFVLALSAGLVALSISYSVCNRDHNCYFNNNDAKDASYLYLSLASAICGILFILLCVMGSRLKNEKVCFDRKPGVKDKGRTLQFQIWAMAIISFVVLCASSYGIYYHEYIVPGQFEGLTKEQSKPQLLNLRNQGLGRGVGFDIPPINRY